MSANSYAAGLEVEYAVNGGLLLLILLSAIAAKALHGVSGTLCQWVRLLPSYIPCSNVPNFLALRISLCNPLTAVGVGRGDDESPVRGGYQAAW